MNIYRVIIVAVAILFLASVQTPHHCAPGGEVSIPSLAPTAVKPERPVILTLWIFSSTRHSLRNRQTAITSVSGKRATERFCGRKSGNCKVTTEGFDANQELADVMVSFFETDEVFYLQPVFAATGNITLPLTLRNMQGKWVGEVDITAKAFPDVSCGWALKSDLLDGIGKFTATLMYDNAPIDCATFRSEANYSILDNGNALLVDIYFNSSSLLGPTELEFAPGEPGELLSVVEFTYDGFTIIQTTTFRRP